MTDVFNKSQRSAIMAGIRGRGNASTELAMVKLLRQRGITNWRRHFAIVGKTDFVFPKTKIALFVDGCFWHGCPRCYSAPKTSIAFWQAKVEKMKKRDSSVSRKLKNLGWKVMRVRECQMKRPNRFLNRLERLLSD